MTKQKLRRLEVGDIAPDFVLPATEGGQVRLEAHPKPVALVFLRHLA